MAGRIPDTILEDILSRVDIVELISGYLPLKRSGRNFKAPCPFHHEKTPSFMVSPDRQIFHCFGCNAGGNAYGFLMRHERLEFLEAVEVLAKKAGVVLPSSPSIDRTVSSIATQLYAIHELATLLYENTLHSPAGSNAGKYLASRGVTDDTVRLFRIGFASDTWDSLLNHLRGKGIALAAIEKSGLVANRESGGYYDRFRNRIIFPICDIRQRTIGFGGRLFSQNTGDSAKYVNSPETPIYSKGKNLYGLTITRDAIGENDFAVVVEGYMDLIVPFQHGLKNIVASLGTALTTEQVRLLKRYTHNVVMVYDPDAAGQAAMVRSVDIFLEEDVNVKIVLLPEGLDPDLFVRKHGIQNLSDRITQAEDIFDFQLGMLKVRYNIKDTIGKKQIAAEILPMLKRVKNQIVRSDYIKKLSSALGIAEQHIVAELDKVKGSVQRLDAHVFQPQKRADISPVEKLLIRLMLEENAFVNRVREHLGPADFQDERTSRIVTAIFEFIEQGKNVEANTLLDRIDDPGAMQCICESAFLPGLEIENRQRIVDDCIQRLKNTSLKTRRQRLSEQIGQAERAGDESTVNSLKQEFHLLLKQGGKQ